MSVSLGNRGRHFHSLLINQLAIGGGSLRNRNNTQGMVGEFSSGARQDEASETGHQGGNQEKDRIESDSRLHSALTEEERPDLR